MYALGRNVAAEILPKYAAASTSLTAAGGGDNTAVNGSAIDQTTFPCKAESIAFLIAALAVLTAAKTLVVTAKIQDSADNSTWADVVASATILTLTATGTSSGAGRLGVDLNTCRRYVRVVFTPDLSATGTDTAVVQCIAILGGLQEVPQS